MTTLPHLEGTHDKHRKRILLTRHSTKMSQDGSCIIRKDCEVPPMPVKRDPEGNVCQHHAPAVKPALCCPTGSKFPHLVTQMGQAAQIRWPYLENGSDFPTGKPLPWVLVSTFPQCTATWLSFCSTNRQYSCCWERKWWWVLNKVLPIKI